MCHSPLAVFPLGSQKQVTPTIPRGMTFFLFTGMKQVMKTAEDSSTISALRGCKHRVTEAKDTEYIFTLTVQENSEHARRHQQHLSPPEMSLSAFGLYSLQCVNRKEQADETIFKTRHAVSLYHLCATG